MAIVTDHLPNTVSWDEHHLELLAVSLVFIAVLCDLWKHSTTFCNLVKSYLTGICRREY